MRCASLSLETAIGTDPVLDAGAADGALSFFLESLGHSVHAVDCSGRNINRMQGIRRLAEHFGSKVAIQDTDLDGPFDFAQRYGAALFLGTLYHLKNPFHALEKLAGNAQYCFLSTRVARQSVDGQTRVERLPLAFLLEPGECNQDSTNYFIFSPAGLMVLVKRAGWIVRGSVTSGAVASDPVTPEGDERMFLLMESAVLSQPAPPLTSP